jgi:integrase
MTATVEALQAVEIVPSTTREERQGRQEPGTGALADTPVLSPLELAIAAWLEEKTRRSAKTRRAYLDTMQRFRWALQHVGLDLDSEPERVADVAQAWVGQPWGTLRQGVSANTRNQRLAILSSFYTHARKRRHLLGDNPMALLDRESVQSYAKAQPLDAGDVAGRLAAIDRRTPAGARDYALLVLALQTGRRASELASLRWGDVESAGADGRLTLTWQHCKGGKLMRDVLPPAVGQALLAWLHVAYGDELEALAQEAPVWRSLARNGSRGQALGVQSLADIWQKRLRTSKVHATRHSFAHAMETVGAKVSDIQARLGHASLQTTGRYLAALGSAENAHGEALAALFGVTPTP